MRYLGLLLTLLGVALLSFTFGFKTAYQKEFPYYNITNYLETKSQENFMKNSNYHQQRALYEIYQSDHPEIIMLGDSITYRANFNELLDTKVLNRGIGGDTTAGFLYRLPEIIERQPKKVFIMGGINDIMQGYSVDEIFANYIALLQRLQKEPVALLVQSTLYTSFTQYNEAVTSLNKQLQAYCQQHNIDYLDLNSALSPQQFLLQAYSDDGVHINAAAYGIWKEALLEYLNKEQQERL